jgi:hypothetical protein
VPVGGQINRAIAF